MATHSSVLAWRIPGTGEPGGLQSVGSHRVGHYWGALEALFPLLAFLFCFRLIFFFFFSGPSTSSILLAVCIKHSRVPVLMYGGGSRYGFPPVLWFTSPSTGVPYTVLLPLISRLYLKRSALSFLKASIIRNYRNQNSDSRILPKHWGRGLLK